MLSALAYSDHLLCSACFLRLCLSTATAPSTYFGDFGRSVLEIRGFVDTPNFLTNYKTRRFPCCVFILKPLNLNDIPHIQVRNLFCDQMGYLISALKPSVDHTIMVVSELLVLISFTAVL